MKQRYVLFFDLAWTGYTGWAIYDMLEDTWVSWGALKPRTVRGNTPDAVPLKYDALKQLIDHAWCQVPDPHNCVVGYEYTDWHHGSDEAVNVGKDRIVIEALAYARLTIISIFANRIPIRGLGANFIRSEFGGTTKADVARLVAAQWPDRFKFERHKHGFLRADGKLLRHDITDALAGCYVLIRALNLERMIEDGYGND